MQCPRYLYLVTLVNNTLFNSKFGMRISFILLQRKIITLLFALLYVMSMLRVRLGDLLFSNYDVPIRVYFVLHIFKPIINVLFVQAIDLDLRRMDQFWLIHGHNRMVSDLATSLRVADNIAIVVAEMQVRDS